METISIPYQYIFLHNSFSLKWMKMNEWIMRWDEMRWSGSSIHSSIHSWSGSSIRINEWIVRLNIKIEIEMNEPLGDIVALLSCLRFVCCHQNLDSFIHSWSGSSIRMNEWMNREVELWDWDWDEWTSWRRWTTLSSCLWSICYHQILDSRFLALLIRMKEWIMMLTLTLR